MKGSVHTVEAIAVSNTDFRQGLHTAAYCQLVVMALDVHADIGEEVHMPDQFFRVERGSGAAVLDDVLTEITAGFAILISAGTTHDIINAGDVPMKLSTLCAPPDHRDGVVHRTRADAEADDEHFDGKTTEWLPGHSPTLSLSGQYHERDPRRAGAAQDRRASIPHPAAQRCIRHSRV